MPTYLQRKSNKAWPKRCPDFPPRAIPGGGLEGWRQMLTLLGFDENVAYMWSQK